MKKKTSDNVKAYGMPTRIKFKVITAVNALERKKIPFNTKLWNICKRLAEREGIDIE
jgi:hypothetical protein